jgi:hypothetical protein
MAALGFDAAVVGAAESRIVAVAEAAVNRDSRQLITLPGIAVKNSDGSVAYSGIPKPEDLLYDISQLMPTAKLNEPLNKRCGKCMNGK